MNRLYIPWLHNGHEDAKRRRYSVHGLQQTRQEIQVVSVQHHGGAQSRTTTAWDRHDKRCRAEGISRKRRDSRAATSFFAAKRQVVDQGVIGRHRYVHVRCKVRIVIEVGTRAPAEECTPEDVVNEWVLIAGKKIAVAVCVPLGVKQPLAQGRVPETEGVTRVRRDDGEVTTFCSTVAKVVLQRCHTAGIDVRIEMKVTAGVEGRPRASEFSLAPVHEVLQWVNHRGAYIGVMIEIPPSIEES
jgi:hypothetical protein